MRQCVQLGRECRTPQPEHQCTCMNRHPNRQAAGRTDIPRYSTLWLAFTLLSDLAGQDDGVPLAPLHPGPDVLVRQALGLSLHARESSATVQAQAVRDVAACLLCTLMKYQMPPVPCWVLGRCNAAEHHTAENGAGAAVALTGGALVGRAAGCSYSCRNCGCGCWHGTEH
jgi:hypothetical protein